MTNVKFALTFIPLVATFNLFPLQDIQKCRH